MLVLASCTLCGLGMFLPELKADAPTTVPSSANWVVHFDLADFGRTALGELLADLPRSEQEERAIAMARDRLGFDFSRDLHSLTLYGPDKERTNAVVLARGNFEVERVRNFLQERNSYSERWHGEHRILQWGDDGRVLFDEPGALAFHPTGIAVLAVSVERVSEALDLLDGKASGWAIEPPPDAGEPYLLAFADLVELGELRPEATLLRQSDFLVLTIGETAESLQVRLLVEAQNVEVARQIESVVLGLQAYALLRSGGDWAGLPDWLLTATIIRDESTLHFSLDAPAGRIAKFLEEQAKRN